MQQTPTVRTNTGHFGAPWWALVIAAFIYVLSPVDLVPEFPLGCIGIVDDIGVGAFGIYCFVKMLKGHFISSATAPVVADVRTVSVEEERSWTSEPRVVTASSQRQLPVKPVPAVRSAAMFVVQVFDDEGVEQHIEVEARDAEHARTSVAALGADGRIGKVWLKRMLGAHGGASTEQR
jgi:hypothetical protein